MPVPEAPGKPEEPGAVIDAATPTFTWTGGVGIDRYGLYISRKPYGEANVVYRNKSISGTENSFQLPKSDALPDGVYRWNLEAFRGQESVGFAEHRYFQVQQWKAVIVDSTEKALNRQDSVAPQTNTQLQDTHDKALQQTGGLFDGLLDDATKHH